MVKILFESVFDILAPESRAALQRLLIQRWNSFAREHHPACDEELSRFCNSCWKPEERPNYAVASSSPPSSSATATFSAAAVSSFSSNDDGDRFSLIQAFVNRADPARYKLAQKARVALYRVAADDIKSSCPVASSSSSTINENSSSTNLGDDDFSISTSIAVEDRERHRLQQTCGSVENEESLDELRLQCDAPIVRCLLGLSQLPDTTLWLVCTQSQEAAFVAQVLRRLPVAPFFEGPSRLWRLLDASTTVFSAPSPCAVQKLHNELRRRTSALAHETMLMVSESLLITQAAAAQKCWVGVHFIGAQLNRAASVEQFDASIPSSSSPSPTSSRGSSQTDLAAAAPAAAGVSAASSSSSPSAAAAASSSGEGTFATARGIAQLGRVIMSKVPELRTALLNSDASSMATSPLLLSSKVAPQRTAFCACGCFFTGVYTGIAAATAAILGIGLTLTIVSVTLKQLGLKGKKSG